MLHKIVQESVESAVEKYPSHKELDMDLYKRIIDAKSWDRMFNYGYSFGKKQSTVSSHISLIEAEIARKKSVSKEIETGSKMIFSSQEKRQAVWEFIQDDIQYLEGELEACKKLLNN